MTAKRTSRKKQPTPPPEPPKCWRLPMTYTAGQLVTVAKLIQAEPETRYIIGEWPGREISGAEWMQWFNEKLTEKINSKMPDRTGRKYGDEYQTELSRMQPYVGSRAIVRYCPAVLGKRVKAAFFAKQGSDDELVYAGRVSF